MNEFKEVTAENLRFVRGAKGKNQAEIAELLGITQTAVSKIEKAQRGLTDSEKHLLDWYFFGKLPPRLSTRLDLKGCLEFTEPEWDLICRIAKRSGMEPGKWIAEQIRTISAARLAIDPTLATTPPVQLKALDKVAEEETPYRSNGNGKGK